MSKVGFGAGFGDECKGTEIEYECSQSQGSTVVVRYNGGHQAGHNIVRPDGTWHCFAQFGSGSFEGCDTYLSEYMYIEPVALLVEADVLRGKGVDVLPRLTVDPKATLVTPAHKMTNQMREVARGRNRHGTCGCGVGDAVLDKDAGVYITVGDIGKPDFEEKLNAVVETRLVEARRLMAYQSNEMMDLWEYFLGRLDTTNLVDLYKTFVEQIRLAPPTHLQGYKTVLFEGSQGTLLDPRHGFAPYVTKAPSTHHGAVSVHAAANLPGTCTKVAILPSFAHRHGMGPLPTETSDLLPKLADPRNLANRWQGSFRVGWFDALLAKYALDLNQGADSVFLSKLDLLTGLPEVKVCVAYLYTGPLEALEGVTVFEPLGRDTAKVTALIAQDVPVGQRLTPILTRCSPLDYRVAKGWSETWVDGWPHDRLLDYVGHLQDLLEVLVSTLSLGPTVNDKWQMGA